MISVTNWVDRSEVRKLINSSLSDLDAKTAALNEELQKVIAQKSESRIVSASDFHQNKEEVLKAEIERTESHRQMWQTYLAMMVGVDDGMVKVEFEL